MDSTTAPHMATGPSTVPRSPSSSFASLAEMIRRRTPPTKQIYHDSFGKQLTDLVCQMRWELAGTALQEWNEIYYPRLRHISENKAKEIYKDENHANYPIIHLCCMLGRDKLHACPTIVLFCEGKKAKPILKRMTKVIYHDGEIIAGGFKLLASRLFDLEPKENSIRRPAERPWATGKNIRRLEPQCECTARMGRKAQKEDSDLEPLIQPPTLASILPEDRGRTVEPYAIQENAADNGQASSLSSQSNVNEQGKQDRFILSYIPGKIPQSLDQDLIEPGTIVKDTTLIRTIRRRYMKHRSWYCRMFSLRGFSNLAIAKFRLYHHKSSDKDVLKPVRCDTWSLPDDTEEWDFDSNGTDDSTLSAYMSGIWAESHSCKCGDQNDSSLQGSPKRSFMGSLLPLEIKWGSEARDYLPPLVPLKFPWSWLVIAKTIRIHARKPTKEDRHDVEQNRELLKNVAIDDVSCDCDSYYIFHSLPKKRSTKLEHARGSRDAPFGWALWVEEDFVIPCYFLALFNLVTIGAFAFGFVYSILYGNQAGGWAIASFLLSAVTFVFTQWVAKVKDSKRPLVTKGSKRD